MDRASYGLHTDRSKNWFVVSGLLCGWLVWGTWLAASGHARERATPAADGLVQRALLGEAEGRSPGERSRLLVDALQEDPSHSPARWHSGQVRLDQRWLKFDEVPALVDADRALMRYHGRRANTPDSIEGHWELANWCAKQGLSDRERAHLNRLLQLSPDHVAARDRLGFVRVDGEWIARSEIARAENESRRAAGDLARWSGTVERIVNDLRADSPRKRKQAQARWDALTDPAAIGAMELALGNGDQASAALLIAKLASIDGHAASLALARQALFHPLGRARAEAAEQLSGRPLEGFVPQLLAGLHTPVQASTEIYREPSGRLVHLQVLAREGRDRREVRVTRTDFAGSRSQGGTRRAAEAAQRDDAELAPEVLRQNEQTAEMNRRVSAALVAATGEGASYTPEQWWAWWNKKNEVFVAGEKPVVTQYEQREQNVSLAAQSSSEGGESLDCLAAGTTVWTDRGAVAIEAVQVGDLVLSQDPESGELAYKPVLRTTVRPASRLVKVTVNGQSLAASGGHPFWVSGRGWLKARELEPGMRLHGVAETVLIEAVEPGNHEQTYNLVVADFHTYFAGADRALSHDNTIRQPTDRVVPGLAAR
jgi:hypothetical protein